MADVPFMGAPISVEPGHDPAGVAPVSEEQAASGISDAEARSFFEHLEQTGQLVDVDASTDMSRLSPRVTHVRRDGKIERIGFA